VDTEGDCRNFNWFPILDMSPLGPSAQHFFAIKNDKRITHVRLNIFPDGGVARFRVYGECIPIFLTSTSIDLASVENGGQVIACSDQHFGSRHNLINPGRGENMGDGWETKRRRGPGFDWIIVKLGAPCEIERIEVDTNFFKGNYPDSCSIDVVNLPTSSGAQISLNWVEFLKKSKLQASSIHTFKEDTFIKVNFVVTHVRLNIYPDGGVQRLRVIGKPKKD